MKSGVVTREIARATAIHARSTVPKRRGAIQPARKNIPAIAAKTKPASSLPRHHEIAPRTANAPASVHAKRRPSLAVNRAEFVFSMIHPETRRADRVLRGETNQSRGNRGQSA